MAEKDTYIEIEEIEDNFSRVPNLALRDKNISLKAKGLYAFLCSNKKDWKIYKSELINHLPDGKDSLNSAFKELEAYGYLLSSPIRDKGMFKGFKLKILINPIETQPLRINRGGLTVDGFSATNNTIYNKTINNNIIKEDFQSSSPFEETIQNPKQPKNKKEKKEDAGIFQICKTFWLESFHPGWAFNAATGSNLYQLITKLKLKLKLSKPDFNDDDVGDLFKAVCSSLPEWYKSKDIPTINSKFNELFEEIKSGINGPNKPAKGESIFRS